MLMAIRNRDKIVAGHIPQPIAFVTPWVFVSFLGTDGTMCRDPLSVVYT